jgi:uncharacterized protein YqgC (DUF456 family)
MSTPNNATTGSPRQNRTAPLAALFVLTTAVGTCLAFAVFARGAEENDNWVKFAGSGAAVGTILGLFMGVADTPRYRGLLLGSITGALAGAALGGMLAVTARELTGATILASVSSLLILSAALASRWQK